MISFPSLSLMLAQAQAPEFEQGVPPIFWVIYLVLLVAMIAGLWGIFTKAGQPGWASLIPIYNGIVLLQVAGRPIWWILLMLIPCVGFVVAIVVALDVAKNFGKGTGFGIGLAFLPFIFYPLLGFGDAVYRRVN
jgi:hypothetical protein